MSNTSESPKHYNEHTELWNTQEELPLFGEGIEDLLEGSGRRIDFSVGANIVVPGEEHSTASAPPPIPGKKPIIVKGPTTEPGSLGGASIRSEILGLSRQSSTIGELSTHELNNKLDRAYDEIDVLSGTVADLSEEVVKLKAIVTSLIEAIGDMSRETARASENSAQALRLIEAADVKRAAAATPKPVNEAPATERIAAHRARISAAATASSSIDVAGPATSLKKSIPGLMRFTRVDDD